MNKSNRANFLMLLLLFHLISIMPFIFAILRATGVNLSLMVVLPLSQTLGFLLPLLFYMKITKQKIGRVLPVKLPGLKNMLLVAAIIVAFTPMMGFLSGFTALFTDNVVEEILMVVSPYPLWALLIVFAVFPSVCEELFFRGALYKEQAPMSFKKLIFVNGLFFGIVHLNIQQFFYAFALGMIFAYFMYFTRNILIPIWGHFCVNGSQILLFYFGSDLQDYNQPVSLPLVAASGIVGLLFMPVVIFLMRLFVKNNSSQVYFEAFEESPQLVTESEFSEIPVSEAGLLNFEFVIILMIFITIVILTL